ncbi:hypothetical protein BDN70DRAFT_871521 [Pholiota conissans]|uniref:Nicotinamide-nucleotide adenylyltransferase n=1 Tax=Pholiota conissans TaxID=109636 RepID=A0A9P5ZFW1_9AGAR|nr:hypothetical protein BDN70DRAFT_871521 [Pholiota conissans]
MGAIRSTAPLLLQRLQRGLSKFELVYTPHARWPLPPAKLAQTQTPKPLRISVLDASFNPPTLAHLGLANSLPFTSTRNAEKDYDAKLLLLSVKNADKMLKPGDARYEQRLEMMYRLTQSMRPLASNGLSSISSPSDPLSPQEAANVAIAIIDEPTFAGKSQVLLKSLKAQLVVMPPPSVSAQDVELTFLVGLDTLERLFSPRYYGSEEAMKELLTKFLAPSGDNSRIVSAKRIMATGSSEEEIEASPFVKQFIDSERIAVIDLGNELSTYSSTTVRRSVNSMGNADSATGAWRRLVTKDVADYIVQERLYVTDL